MTTFRPARASDAAGIAAIYAPYVADTAITFELDPPDAAEMAARLAEVQARHPWLVAEDADGSLLGYAYASPFKARAAYRWIVETTIYLAPRAQGRGLGRALYEALLDTLTRQGFVAATGLIALPNAASVTLHERLGFSYVGTFDAAGYKLGCWHDVGYWQKQLGPRYVDPDETAAPLHDQS